MTTEDKITYALEHPELGRLRLSKVLGISEQEARTIKKICETMETNKQTKSINQEMVKFLSTGMYSLTDIANRFDLSPAKAQVELDTIRKAGYLVHTYNDQYTAGDTIDKEHNYSLDYRKNGETELIYGAVADTHLGSKYARLDVLNALYDRFADNGITKVFHGGNWIDGEARFNKNDLYVHGIQDQLNYFIDNYPQRNGIENYILSGDDHEGWYVQREHINIGRLLESEAKQQGRNDLVDAGYMERDFELKQKKGSSIIRLIHAGGGSAYAVSYTSQKYVESLQGGEKPQIILVGHYHKFEYGYPREVHVVQLGCVQDQTPFMRKKKLQAHLGGCIIRIKQTDIGTIASVNVEWIPFYDKSFYEKKW